jgi:hypothetical protein
MPVRLHLDNFAQFLFQYFQIDCDFFSFWDLKLRIYFSFLLLAGMGSKSIIISQSTAYATSISHTAEGFYFKVRVLNGNQQIKVL